jgi:purine-binding chemotaxis protein CheW
MLNNSKQTTVLSQEATLPLLVFKVGEQAYGVFVNQVLRIIEMVTITQVNQVAQFIAGLINYQGQAVPLIDMSLRLGFTKKPYGLHTPIILVSLADSMSGQAVATKMLGLIVDEVEQVIYISPDSIKHDTTKLLTEMQLLKSKSQTATIYGIAHVGHRMVILLDISTLLHPDEYHTLETLELSAA